jgi:hypothetical protein
MEKREERTRYRRLVKPSLQVRRQDLMKLTLYQLSYGPAKFVGATGIRTRIRFGM